MREIKFRGKTEQGDWRYTTCSEDMAEFWMNVNDGFIDPETVGMWTGLKDKNGVEIYEDDVVIITDGNEYLPDSTRFNDNDEGYEDFSDNKFIIYWDENFCGFYIKPADGNRWDGLDEIGFHLFTYLDASNYDVIGNIREKKNNNV